MPFLQRWTSARFSAIGLEKSKFEGAASLEDLTPAYFKLGPRPSSMSKHGVLAAAFIKVACNGVLSPFQTTKGILELLAVEPNLKVGIKNEEKFALLLSRGLRTLLTWFREYRKGKTRRSILRQLPSSQEAFLDNVVQNMVLKKITAKDLK